jgi:hypothetical protein
MFAWLLLYAGCHAYTLSLAAAATCGLCLALGGGQQNLAFAAGPLGRVVTRLPRPGLIGASIDGGRALLVVPMLFARWPRVMSNSTCGDRIPPGVSLRPS